MPKIILVANTSWYLYNFRLSLANYLQAHGFEVLMSAPPDRFSSALEAAGFRWIGWDLGRQTLAPWAEIPALLQAARAYQREKPDLVHHSTIKPVIYGSLAARRAGVPAVVNAITGRGYAFLGSDRKARLLRWIVPSLYRLAFRHPNQTVIFENRADQEIFESQRILAPGQGHLIEGVGVDTGRFTPLPSPPVNGAPVVVMATRMLRDKGVGTLVEAARRLKERSVARFVLVGEPDPGNPSSIPAETLRGWAEEGAVEWWGWQEDIRAVYAQSHIVTLPSLGEGVPTALLEAAACARPIVATDVPGCRDVVIHGHNGLLVPPNDPAALAAAIETLAVDAGLRDRMGEAGRQLVLEKFTSERVNAATLGIIRQVLRAPAGRPPP